MTTPPPFDTHRVENQPPPFEPADLWTGDRALREAVAREGGDWAQTELSAYGRICGDEIYRLGFDANRDRPRLVTHDRFGHRIDRVEFHPAYHRIMQLGVEHGVSNFAWRHERPGAQVARAALTLMHHQAEAGSNCPLTMTAAAVPVLRREAALAEWASKAIAPHYDSHDVPMADKAGVTIGMGMTEKQGGSDVRSNTSVATPLPADGAYSIVGHKWFLSAPMCDAFLVLAQAPGGLTCFLLPRWCPDGTRNALRLMRLKDKVGNWSNASSEVEFTGAFAQRIGAEGKGVATIIEMVALTRLDCALGAAAEMRMALAQALHHARHRRAFGRRLIEQPLMMNVLTDIAIESEAATALALRIARAVDAAPREPAEAAFARAATAIGKYWLTKRAVPVVNEAQECLGGAGYVEDSIMGRLYREAPLNSIWEGCGNIQCLDVLRAIERDAGTREALFAEIEGAAGLDEALEEEVEALTLGFSQRSGIELRARFLVERLALALQSSVLLHAAAKDRSLLPVAAAFCRSRLDSGRGLAFGTLEDSVDFDAIIARVLP
ncbi:MAG TPA: acyl-CoA dehydrogenase family protein [Xanthomonadaceae bacterium]|nr:acyl-CoA dehydrogenase family protein [Xanthomonadaceae bacterium]